MRPGLTVNWPDTDQLRRSVEELKSAAPLVSFPQVQMLCKDLGRVAEGRAIILQGGDCAESFEATSNRYVVGQITLLKALADMLKSTGHDVVVIARAAGQCFKPRSDDYEQLPSGLRLLKYRGDGINSSLPVPALRVPDARRLSRAYRHSQNVLETMRQFEVSNEIGVRAIYASHEALALPYEQPLTRPAPAEQQVYCSSTHLPWIGVRSNEPSEEHVSWAATISNPIAVKIGPNTSSEHLVALAQKLDPVRIPGRLIFITRLGASHIAEQLPDMIRAVQSAGWKPIWLCDPMHGNSVTRMTDGIRVRALTSILAELTSFYGIHKSIGTHPGGLHLELTHQSVTECVYDTGDIETAALDHYLSLGDPRLNADHATEIVVAARELLMRW